MGQQVWPRVPHAAIIGWQLPLMHASPEPHAAAPAQQIWPVAPHDRQVPPAHAREEPQAIPLAQHGWSDPPQTTVPESPVAPASVPGIVIRQAPLTHAIVPAHAGPEVQHG